MYQTLIELNQKTIQITQVPPVAGTLPLVINHRIAGYISVAASCALDGHPYLQKHANYLHLQTPSDTTLSAILNQIAQQLYEAKVTPFWRDEQLSVFAEGQLLGHIERTATRPLGLLTRAVQLNAFTPDGLIYLALRAPTKQTDPNKWDTLVGGLLNHQDTIEEGLWRETYEEAGLHPEQILQRSPVKLITRVHRPLPEGYQVENIYSCNCILDPDTVPCNIDGEVVEITTFEVKQVLAMMQLNHITAEAQVVILDSILQQTK